jgi:hypothetical protein
MWWNDLTEKQWQVTTARQTSKVVEDGQRKELYRHPQRRCICLSELCSTPQRTAHLFVKNALTLEQTITNDRK